MTDETDATSRPDPSKPIPLGGPVASPSERKPEVNPKAVQPESPVAARPLLPVVGAIGFAILAGCIAYLWTRPMPTAPMPVIPPDQSGVIAALRGEVSSLQSALAALDGREKSDIANLHAAIAALPSATAASTPEPAVSTAPPPAPDVSGALAQLKGQIAQLQAAQSVQAQTAQSLPSASTIASLAARVDAIAQREAKDGDTIRQDLTAVQQQMAVVTGQAQSLAKTTSALPQLTARSDRMGQLLRAQEALRAGQPLGTIDNAPPALARYANAAPPTEAGLVLSFPDAARAARKAGQPALEQGGFWHRIWMRVQDLVTVRQGDRVVVGDPTSGTLARAQRLLDAGDLAGAVTVVDSLTGPAAVAMAPWQAQAKALLAARQALAQMAAG